MPDFANLRIALLSQGEPKRVPQFEMSIDEEIKRRFLGRPADTLEAEIDFYMRAGYDFVPLTMGIRQTTRGETSGLSGAKPSQTSVLKPVAAQYNPFQGGSTIRMWAEEGQGLIRDERSFADYPWPDPDKFDYSIVEKAGKLLPAEARAILLLGAVFTASWMLMGMEAFFLSLAEGSGLVPKLFQKVGEIQLRVTENLLQFDCVGGICMPDDLAHCNGLLVSPDLLRQHVFPWNRRIGDRVRAKNVIYLYHSDGQLYEVLDDLLACGFHSVHPCERSSMDMVKLKQKYGGRLCLCGNIDLDSTLTLGTPQDVAEEVKERIRTIGPGGGYCCGSSNSVPEYVPYENYLAMIEAVKEYGTYPIRC